MNKLDSEMLQAIKNLTEKYPALIALGAPEEAVNAAPIYGIAALANELGKANGVIDVMLETSKIQNEIMAELVSKVSVLIDIVNEHSETLASMEE